MSYVASNTRVSRSPFPCSSKDAPSPPQSIGDHYYCDSGNPTSTLQLRDGQQCEGTRCTGTNSLPWFSVQFPAPITDLYTIQYKEENGQLSRKVYWLVSPNHNITPALFIDILG